MENYSEGIKQLKNGLNDLQKVKDDIKNNNTDQIESDWKKVTEDLGKAYIYMPDFKEDPNIPKFTKFAALRAYESFTKAAVNPANASHVDSLAHNVERLVADLEKINTNALPEWK